MNRLYTVLFFLTFISAIYSQNCPSDMIHYWKFDEISGPPYIDSIGSANAFSSTPPSQTSGIVNNAQYFNGTNEVNVSPESSFDWGPNDSFTIEYWLKSSSTLTGNRVIVGRDDPGTSLHWWSGVSGTGIPTFYLISTTGELANLTGTFNVRDDNWHHISVVRNGIIDSIYLYVDGVLDDLDFKDYQDGFESDTSKLNIGYLNLGPHYRYTGSIDEIAFYNRALSPVEIISHYGNGFAGQGYCNPTTQIAYHSQVVSSNNPITLKVIAYNVTDLFASSVTIEFDNTLFQFAGITEGNFLESNPDGYNVLYKSNSGGESTMDSVIVDEAILGRSTSSGTGVLFYLVLVPLRAGIGNINIRSFIFRDLNNVPISAVPINAEIKTNSPAPNIKVYLEGPYQGGTMSSLLPELGLLPLIQPFDASPWNYSGFEKVSSSFFTTHPEIVDWVLVELRSGIAENTTVATRAALLNENGSLVDIDGVSPVSFFVVSTNQYYIVIRHRNHLDVMSSAPVDVNFSSTLFDFTISGANAYGTNAMKEVASGVFAMYAGDGNNDGFITGSDFNIFNPLFRSGAAGYLMVDWNLDGLITGTDFNYFNPNFRTGQISQVP